MVGLLIVGIGELLRVWAAGHLRKNLAVITTGPYAFVKNPLYLGTLLIILGLGLIARIYWLLAIGLGIFIAYYAPYKKRRETQRMVKRFGQSWNHYALEVPDYLPRLKPYSRVGSERWRWHLVVENSEHLTLIAVAVGSALLGLRWWLSVC